MYQRVVVTVKRKDEARVRDLEVPVNIDASRLAEMIARALRWESDMAGQRIMYVIEAHPLGRILQPDETLASAGVWDGSWLVLHPVQPPSAQQPETPPAEPAQAQPAAPEPAQAAVQTTPETADAGGWTFPAAENQPQPAPEPVPAPAPGDSLLERLLTGEPIPAGQGAPKQPTAEADAPGAPAAPEPEQTTQPAPIAPEAAAWSAQPQEAAAAENPESSPSLLEALLGGSTEQAPSASMQAASEPRPDQAQADAGAWTFPTAPVSAPELESKPESKLEPARAQADEWNFPVAEPHHLEAALQAQDRQDDEQGQAELQPQAQVQAQPQPGQDTLAWTFPVAPPEPEAEPVTPAAPEQPDDSLLAMLLGSSPAAAPEAPAPAPESQPEPQAPERPAAAAASTPAPDSAPAPAPAAGRSPVGGFRSLGIDLPPASEPEPGEKKPGFVWKKLDD